MLSSSLFPGSTYQDLPVSRGSACEVRCAGSVAARLAELPRPIGRESDEHGNFPNVCRMFVKTSAKVSSSSAVSASIFVSKLAFFRSTIRYYIIDSTRLLLLFGLYDLQDCPAAILKFGLFG